MRSASPLTGRIRSGSTCTFPGQHTVHSRILCKQEVAGSIPAVSTDRSQHSCGQLELFLTTGAYCPMPYDDRPLPGQNDGTNHVHIRTFLIADVRGYTLFT